MSKKINIEQRMAEREMAFRSVFLIPFYDNSDSAAESIASFAETVTEEPIDDLAAGLTGDFFRALTQSVLEQLSAIDETIEKYIKKGWTMERIPRAELAVLRLAVAELKYLGTPKQIVINEAVNLAKKYGDEEGYVFVNGILHQFASDQSAEKHPTQTES